MEKHNIQQSNLFLNSLKLPYLSLTIEQMKNKNNSLSGDSISKNIKNQTKEKESNEDEKIKNQVKNDDGVETQAKKSDATEGDEDKYENLNMDFIYEGKIHGIKNDYNNDGENGDKNNNIKRGKKF